MHGCDADRSESMLGFLKSVDFRQTLLVSAMKRLADVSGGQLDRSLRSVQ
jgi:hypothetical protein